MHIAVGLSGGVDSSTVCYLLKSQGNEVSGITMKTWNDSYADNIKGSGCFGYNSLANIAESKKVCEKLKIPHYTIDLSKEFKKCILEYYKNEYTAGRTPNPCVFCNQKIKFDLLMKKTYEAGINFDRFATGHYAKVEYDQSLKRYILKKGIDEKKDQSYFLSMLSQEQLSKLLFPLGGYFKKDIRLIAKEANLPVHEKKESQDFYLGTNSDLIDEIAVKGNIVDKHGRTLGYHKGIYSYTIGQRKGLGIAYKHPLYVTGIDKENNMIIAGEKSDLLKKIFYVKDLNWIFFDKFNDPINVKARIRYLHKEAEAMIIPEENNMALVKFKEPQYAITPGQIAVFYDNDIVLGAGTIEKVLE
ncbi:MAG: tRNA 2-thiouridine(34) synthase MnmA [Spirochaetes bacterium]|nr:tRNA 2-thiouridine(34) synthase MnmA [Spirochaetota bacterium]